GGAIARIALTMMVHTRRRTAAGQRGPNRAKTGAMYAEPTGSSATASVGTREWKSAATGCTSAASKPAPERSSPIAGPPGAAEAFPNCPPLGRAKQPRSRRAWSTVTMVHWIASCSICWSEPHGRQGIRDGANGPQFLKIRSRNGNCYHRSARAAARNALPPVESGKLGIPDARVPLFRKMLYITPFVNQVQSREWGRAAEGDGPTSSR